MPIYQRDPQEKHPKGKTNKPEKVSWQKWLEGSNDYKIMNALGIEKSFSVDDENSYRHALETLRKEIREKISSNTEAENIQVKEHLGKTYPKSEGIIKRFDQLVKETEENKTKDEGIKTMADNEKTQETNKDWTAELKDSDVFKKALEAKIDVSGYAPKTEDEYKQAIKKLAGELEGAKEGAGKDASPSDDGKDEGKKKALVVDEKGDEGETLDNSWINETRQNLQESAQATGSVYQEDDPENASKTSLSFKLVNKDQEVSEAVYVARDRVNISKDSKFEMYQAVVHDAIKKDLTITIAEKLNPTQQLMLYAAVLDSKETYQDGQKPEITNPPAIDMNGEIFKTLPENVQAILKAEVERQQQEAKAKEIDDHLKELQSKIDARKAAMTPEERASREAKETELNAIRDARLGKTGPYTVTYKEDVLDKDGNIVHKKGDTKKIVEKNEEFIKAYNERQEIIAKNLGKERGK